MSSLPSNDQMQTPSQSDIPLPIVIHIFQFHILFFIVQSWHLLDTQRVAGTAPSASSALRCAAGLLSRSHRSARALSSQTKRVASDCNTRSARVDSIFQIVTVARNALAPVARHVGDALPNPCTNAIHTVSYSAHESAGIVAHARHAALHCAVDPVASFGWFLLGSGGARGRSGCFCGWCSCCGRSGRCCPSYWGFGRCASGGFV